MTTQPASDTRTYDQVLDVDAIRERARSDVAEGPLTSHHPPEYQQVLHVLDRALATEFVCMLRYRQHYEAAHGLQAKAAADEFLAHSQQEFEHAGRIARRITQLGGTPDLDPSTFASRSHAEYRPSDNLHEMLTENLVAERIAIETYRQSIQWLGDKDPTTRRLLEEILEVEEEHADDLASLLARA